MKKVLSIILAGMMTVSLTACGNNATTEKAETNKEVATEGNKTEEAETAEEVKYDNFGALLNSIAEKDYGYSEVDTLKIMKEEEVTKYQEKAKAVVDKAMEDNKIDVSKAKVYPYYINVNGDKSEKDYVVVYGDDKVPTTVYEIILTVSDEYEPSLKEVKEVKDLINDQFKTLFAEEVK
ncbi:MAG: hypothetical protein KID00_09765 [Clostridium argentinense]|uniref:Lipoprotein n=1 Tax=Clostridium faecium TaxID=2762223 RepID=A0ABR8YWD3_9CLOT|nr:MULTISPECIES: hypothetical protein [Clostridium]MBD8048603.1 hypothetical protein [Clostridium faecium]MBS5824128.1 hypothetical protein [Clostridium argentinense]MDU1348607.1 hypothetical protein [Clostridium argentinense]